MQGMRTCEKCKSRPLARGLCSACYNFAYRHQGFTPRRRKSAEETFGRSYLVDASGCWLWTGARFKTGYGGLRADNGRTVRAHRFSYELRRGPIPPGLDVMHACDVRLCVNPAHLSIGTRLDNMRDAVAKGRTKPFFKPSVVG
jgi:hypothetical protein